MTAELPIEFLPALFGISAYVLYRLLLPTAPGQHVTKKEEPSEPVSEPASPRLGSGVLEPDQEPPPAPEKAANAVKKPSRSAATWTVPLACGIGLLAIIFALAVRRGLHNHGEISAPSPADVLDCGGSCSQEALVLNSTLEALVLDSTPEVLEENVENQASTSMQDGGNALTITLTRQSVTEDDEEDFVRSAYYGTLMIGSPPEPFTVVFDTGSGHLVLPSTYCKSETCRVHKRYRRSASSTGRDINHNGKLVASGELRDQITVSFGTGEVTGVFVEDVVCVDRISDDKEADGVEEVAVDLADEDELPTGCVNLKMIAATELSEDPFKSFQFDGILGLGLDGLSQTPDFNFLSVVAQSVSSWGGSHPQTFAVFLAESDSETSEIALGGWSPKHLKEDLAWNPVYEPEMGHWLVSIKSIRVGKNPISFCEDGTCKAAVDTGTSLLAVPTEAFPELYELLKHPTPLSGHCRGMGPLLHIELDSYTVTLGSRDYARPEKTGFGRPKQRLPKAAKASNSSAAALPAMPSPAATRRDLRCAPTLMTLDLPEPLGPKLFILGEPILRKYYTAYDAQSKQVGLARARHVNAPSRDELLVMAVEEGIVDRAPNMFDVFRWRKSYR